MPRRLLYSLSIFCLLCLLPGASAAASCAILELDDDKGACLRQIRLDPKRGFAIRYIHSVALSPVTDYFDIKGKDIVVARTEYMDFGAGLPHAPEKGQKMRAENGHIIIDDINLVMPEFTLRVGRVARHTLLLPNAHGFDELPLAEIAAPGAAVTFKIRDCAGTKTD